MVLYSVKKDSFGVQWCLMSEIKMHADFLFVSYPERIFEFDFKEMKNN